jgi:hypothetical protein
MRVHACGCDPKTMVMIEAVTWPRLTFFGVIEKKITQRFHGVSRMHATCVTALSSHARDGQTRTNQSSRVTHSEGKGVVIASSRRGRAQKGFM